MGRTAKVEDAVVEQAAVEDAVVKQDAEPQKKGEKLIRFKIPLGSADKDRADVFVAVNGKSYLIKRGVPTELPESVVDNCTGKRIGDPGSRKTDRDTVR